MLSHLWLVYVSLHTAPKKIIHDDDDDDDVTYLKQWCSLLKE